MRTDRLNKESSKLNQTRARTNNSFSDFLSFCVCITLDDGLVTLTLSANARASVRFRMTLGSFIGCIDGDTCIKEMSLGLYGTFKSKAIVKINTDDQWQKSFVQKLLARYLE